MACLQLRFLMPSSAPAYVVGEDYGLPEAPKRTFWAALRRSFSRRTSNSSSMGSSSCASEEAHITKRARKLPACEDEDATISVQASDAEAQTESTETSHSRGTMFCNPLFEDEPASPESPACEQVAELLSRAEALLRQRQKQGLSSTSGTSLADLESVLQGLRNQPQQDQDVLRGMLGSILQELEQYDKGIPVPGKPWMHRKVLLLQNEDSPQIGMTVTYADVDQMGAGGAASCVMFCLAAAHFFHTGWCLGCSSTQSRSATCQGQLLSDTGLLGEWIRLGAELWRDACAELALGKDKLFGFQPALAFLQDRQRGEGAPLLYETLEAYCSIAGPQQSEGFHQLGHLMASRPAAYLLIAAEHCTCAIVHTSGGVEWCNSLGRSLDPLCDLGHVCLFASMDEFVSAYIAQHAGAGALQVEAHGLGVSARKGGPEFFAFV